MSRLFSFGKRPKTLLGSRAGSVPFEASANRINSILDFILDHVKGDERPYLKVDILGITLLGLLDSGASDTVVGHEGWELIKKLGIPLDSSKTNKVTVANGQSCNSIGKCTIPMKVRDKVIVLDVMVIPELPRSLFLGRDFWVKIGIVPDLRSDEWHFSDNPELMSIHQIKGGNLLNSLEKARLQAVIDRNFE